MRPAIVLGALALVYVAAIIFGDGPDGSFDERFADAEQEMEAMSQSIENDLASPPPDPQTSQ